MPDQKQISELVSRAQNGDTGAFESLYANYEKRVYYYCKRLMANENAGDVMRETFVYIKRNITSLPEDFTILRWIYANAFYVGKIRLASDRGTAITIDPADGNEFRYDELQELPRPEKDPGVRKSDLDAVDAIFDQLSDSQRICLLLHDYAGFTVDETASIVLCDTDAVRAHVASGRLRIQDGLDKLSPGTGTELLPFIPVLLKTCGKVCHVPEQVTEETREAFNTPDENEFFDRISEEDDLREEGASRTTQRILWVVAALVFVGAAVFLIWWFGRTPSDPKPAESSDTPATSEEASSQSPESESESSVPAEESEQSEFSLPDESSETPGEISEPTESSEPTENSSAPIENEYPRAQTNLNLRDAPNTSGKKLAVIPGGKHVTILETVTNDSGEKWYRISFVDDYGNTYTGYCSAEYIELQ